MKDFRLLMNYLNLWKMGVKMHRCPELIYVDHIALFFSKKIRYVKFGSDQITSIYSTGDGTLTLPSSAGRLKRYASFYFITLTNTDG